MEKLMSKMAPIVIRDGPSSKTNFKMQVIISKYQKIGPIWIKSGSSIKTNFKMQVIISKYKKMGPIWKRKGLSKNAKNGTKCKKMVPIL